MTRKRKPNILSNEKLELQKDILLTYMRGDWENLQKRARKEKILRYAKEGGGIAAKILLTAVAVGGILTVAMIAPNVFGAVGKLKKNTTFINKKDFEKHKRYLTKRGLLKVKKDNEKTYTLTLTPYGATMTLKIAYDTLAIKPQSKWDKKWRIVLFDIPEKHKSERESLRNKLRQIGFYQFQRSAFAHPYPCFEKINCVASILNVTSYLKFLETDTIIDDDDMKKFFRLS